MDEPLLQHFSSQYIPSHVQHVAWPFDNLARQIASQVPRNPERTVCLRKLLEARDAAIRAQLQGEVPNGR